MIYSRTEPTLIYVGSTKITEIHRQMFVAFRNSNFTHWFFSATKSFNRHFFVMRPNFRPVGKIGSCTKSFNRKKTEIEAFRRQTKWAWENTDSTSQKREGNLWKNALPDPSVFWDLHKKIRKEYYTSFLPEIDQESGISGRMEQVQQVLRGDLTALESVASQIVQV